jgi:class 3 adenylate cyclase
MTVLDTVGAARPVLMGGSDSGAMHALLASNHPDRVASLIWMDPQARAIWAPDYPQGTRPERVSQLLRAIERGWGTESGVRAWFAAAGESPLDQVFIRHWSRASRLWLTPDVAPEYQRIWFETDVRSILPSVTTPTLLMATEGAWEEMEFVASLIPGCETITFRGTDFFFDVDRAMVFKKVRQFTGMPHPQPELETVLATVLFSDIVGSTEKQAQLGNHGWKELVLRHHAVVRDSLLRWHGIERDTAGDGFYATFDGPARAIRCGQEIAQRVRSLGIQVRVGIHTGECELIDEKFGGLAVSIGARVAGKAGPSDVLISQTVKDLTAGSGLTLEDAGQHELKGVPGRWHLYRVATEYLDLPSPRSVQGVRSTWAPS